MGGALEKGFDYVSSLGLENRAEEAHRALAARTTAVGFGVRDLQAKLDALGSGEPSADETASIATDAQELLGN